MCRGACRHGSKHDWLQYKALRQAPCGFPAARLLHDVPAVELLHGDSVLGSSGDLVLTELAWHLQIY